MTPSFIKGAKMQGGTLLPVFNLEASRTGKEQGEIGQDGSYAWIPSVQVHVYSSF